MTEVMEYDPILGNVEVQVDPSYVSSFLSGIEFPADKFDIVDAGTANGAPEDVRLFLDRLPRGIYRTYSELISTINSM